jgi:hypothetical protein
MSSRFIVEISAPDIDRTSGRADQFWRNKLASSLRTIADCVQTGRTAGKIDAGELHGNYELVPDETADAA